MDMEVELHLRGDLAVSARRITFGSRTVTRASCAGVSSSRLQISGTCCRGMTSVCPSVAGSRGKNATTCSSR